MNQLIQSKLAFQVAQLVLERAGLEAERDQLLAELNRTQAERDQLLAELEQVTAPTNEEKGEQA